jgi:hypothetical protein
MPALIAIGGFVVVILLAVVLIQLAQCLRRKRAFAAQFNKRIVLPKEGT